MTSVSMRLWNDEEAASAAEYALMLFMVAAATVMATTRLKNQVIALFEIAKTAFGG